MHGNNLGTSEKITIQIDQGSKKAMGGILGIILGFVASIITLGRAEWIGHLNLRPFFWLGILLGSIIGAIGGYLLAQTGKRLGCLIGAILGILLITFAQGLEPVYRFLNTYLSELGSVLILTYLGGFVGAFVVWVIAAFLEKILNTQKP